MYNHNAAMLSNEYLSHFLSNDASETSNIPMVLPPPLILPDKLGYNEFDSVINSCGSSDSYGSSSSMASYVTQRPSFIQRSVSSHSLQKNGFCPPVSSSGTHEFSDTDADHVRRVYSAGDLNRISVMQQSYQRSESPLSNESSSSIIEGMMSKACRYSPEEKKERIERYRSKRTQRNFTKKIKYACRKTLADSRPRIRGRFARNEDFEKSPDQVEWGQLEGEEDDEDDDNWVNFLDALSANLNP